MKALIPILSAGLLIPAHGQTAYTAPSGYVKVDIAGASGGNSSLTTLAATLKGEVAFSGSATLNDDFGSNQQTLSVSGVTWAADQWTSSPHVLSVEDLNGGEQTFLVTANTTGGIVTISSTFDLLAEVGSPAASRFSTTPKITIRQATTLKNVFESAEASIDTSDIAFLWDGSQWGRFIKAPGDNPTGGWFDLTNGGIPADNAVVMPSEGIFFQRTAGGPFTLTIFGDVPTKNQVSVVGQGLTFLSTGFPVGIESSGGTSSTKLSDINIESLSGWTSSDILFSWNGSTWTRYIFTPGTNPTGGWFNLSAGGTPADDVAILPNDALFIQRNSAPADEGATFTNSLPYTVE